MTSRIKEALYNADGNATKAIQQITAWSQQDHQLLHALTRAHLGGIVAYHVERVSSGKSVQDKPAPSARRPVKNAAAVKPEKRRVDVRKGSPFGQAILRAASSPKASIFGLESYDAPTRDDKISQRQIDAMKHIASFSHPSDNKRS